MTKFLILAAPVAMLAWIAQPTHYECRKMPPAEVAQYDRLYESVDSLQRVHEAVGDSLRTYADELRWRRDLLHMRVLESAGEESSVLPYTQGTVGLAYGLLPYGSETGTSLSKGEQ